MTRERPQEPLRILHLSDIHFSKSTEWDASPVLVGLCQAVKNLVERGLAPDVVAITGDVAFSDKKTEYDWARKWINEGLLKTLPDLTEDRVLIVPGNHDVDRGSVGAAAEGLQLLLLQEKSQDQVAKALRNKDDRGALLKRHAAAAAITATTRSIALTVSQSTGTVRVWRWGKLITEIEKSTRAPGEPHGPAEAERNRVP
ncbi:MAG: metallophosphoesterase [Planctomycetota bacterium]